jgi:RluA family pseudouridine synthase
LDALYEDEWLLALDKPAELHTVPEPETEGSPDIMSLLHGAIAQGKPWAVERGMRFLKNANRLDHGVSGLLLLAKSQDAYTALANAFGSEQIARRYSAISQGRSDDNEFEIEAKIAPHPERPGVMRVDSRFGKKARTSFQVAERFCGWLFLRCFPQPDRPHQTRLHLSYKRLPVIGDPLYRGGSLRLSAIKPGFRLKPNDTERPLMTRPALHLDEISLKHPVTGKDLLISAGLPKDMAVALKYLRKYAGAA